MINRKSRNKRLYLPLDKEEHFIDHVQHNINDMLEVLVDLEGDSDDKEFIADGLTDLEYLLRAIVYAKGLPKHMKCPWDVDEMS